jgi:hypothetical protein
VSLADRLAAELEQLARLGSTVGYGELARRLDIPGPGSIATLTGALEATMADDAGAGRPLRAAVCTGRLAGGLPARGFFATAALLGRYSGPTEGPEALAFVESERRAIYSVFQKD